MLWYNLYLTIVIPHVYYKTTEMPCATELATNRSMFHVKGAWYGRVLDRRALTMQICYSRQSNQILFRRVAK